MTWRIRGKTFLERKKAAILSEKAQGKGRDAINWWDSTLEGPSAAVDTIVRFSKLGMKS